ncbi:unnamed protein product [Cercopithifilaria johnstoni]|uniref:Uncharacterized protein n=1 Tax=Cercopithifilaria johnstoni TaxID=2874296 RepID=A0A8J2MLP8_9BILA|nr:unnamed protein product [Cercopithifilaria johnstoni]
MDPNSKIQRIHHSPFNLTTGTPTQFRPIYSPPVYPLTPHSPIEKKKDNFIPDLLSAALPKGLSSSRHSVVDERNISRSTREIPSTHDQPFKHDKSLRLSGSTEKNDNKKSPRIPTTRNISNQAAIAMNSCFPETSEQVLTAHELSREIPKFNKSSKEDKKQHFTEVPRKSFDTRSEEIRSRKTLSSLQQLNSSCFISEQEPKDLRSCPADVLLESEKKSSTVSEKSRALSHKRKFGLLPPTPSIISCSPKQHSTDRDEESIISQPSTVSEESLSEVRKDAHIASKKTPRLIRSHFGRLPLQDRSMKSGFIDQSKSEPQVQTTHIVIPISTDMYKSFGSNAPTVRQTSASKPIVVKKISSVSSKLAKNESEANKTKGTSVIIQSKDEKNFTIQLNINLQIKNKEDESNKKHSLKPERVLVRGREVYRKKDGYRL